MASKPCTGLRTCPSEAKNLQESDFDVKTNLAPPKSNEIDEKPIRSRIFFRKKFRIFFSKNYCRRQKIKNCKLSETRVAEVSRRSEPCSQSSWGPRRDSRSVNNLVILISLVVLYERLCPRQQIVGVLPDVRTS